MRHFSNLYAKMSAFLTKSELLVIFYTFLQIRIYCKLNYKVEIKYQVNNMEENNNPIGVAL